MRGRCMTILMGIAVMAIATACAGSPSNPGTSGSTPSQGGSRGGGGQGSQTSTPPGTVISSDNAACIFTAAQMSAILGHQVTAENLAPHVPADHICGFGAIRVGHKYLYYSSVEVECGSFGAGQYSDWNTGSHQVPGTHTDVRTSPSRFGGYFVKLKNGCTASDIPGFNMRTGHMVPGSKGAAAAALDQYASLHGG